MTLPVYPRDATDTSVTLLEPAISEVHETHHLDSPEQGDPPTQRPSSAPAGRFRYPGFRPVGVPPWGEP